MARDDWEYGLHKTDDDGNFLQVIGGVGPLEIAKDGETITNLVTGDTYDLTAIGSGGSSSDTRTDVSEDGNTVVSDVEDINLSTYLSASDDGDGSVTARFDELAHLVDYPNYEPAALMMADGDVVDNPVRVPDGATLEVYRWGAFLLADGTAPSGLQVQLLDGGDTTQASANTPNQEDTAAPVASYQNSSGSLSVFKLRVENATGTDYTSDGIGTKWVYRVIA